MENLKYTEILKLNKELIGKIKSDEFIASDVLLKCPSKYATEKPQG